MSIRLALALSAAMNLLLVGAASAAKPSSSTPSVGAASAAMLSPENSEDGFAAHAAPTEAADDTIESFDESADPFADADEEVDPRAAAQQAAIRAALTRPAADPAPADPSLRPVFDEFGGEAGLTALMDDFMVRLLADARTRPFFEQVDQVKVKRHLVEQFCRILGGGCAYTGRDMVQAHAGLGIVRSEFNALVEALQLAMNAQGIPFRAQNKLLAKLAPMHREVEDR
jgi:hemoglobin